MRDYLLLSFRIAFSVWTRHDMPLAFRLWGNPLVTKYLTPAGVFTETEIRARLEREMAAQESFGYQCRPVFHRDESHFMGVCGLYPRSEDGRSVEIGCNLVPDYQRQGYGTEAVKTVLDFALFRLRAEAVFAGHHADNVPPAKLPACLGFVRVEDVPHPVFCSEHPLYLYTGAGKGGPA